MIKESTRKGWAGIAAVVLAFAGITAAAAPASAASSNLTIAPLAGTSTTGILNHYFVMKTTGVAATSTDIKYFVEGAVTTDITVDVIVARSTENLDINEVVTYATTDATADVALEDATDKTISIDPRTDWVTANAEYIAIAINGSTEQTIKITPFEDNVQANGEIDTGETRGNTIEVTFKPADDITVSTALTLSSITGTEDTAVVTLSDVNMQSVRQDASSALGTVEFQLDGNAASSEDVTFDATAYSTVYGGYVVVNTATTWTQDVNTVTSAKAKLTDGSAYGAADLKTLGESPVASMDVSLDYLGQYVDDQGSDAANFRDGSGTLTIKANVNALDGETAAGHSVSFKLSETGVNTAAGASFTVNGSTLTPADAAVTEDVTVTVPADADGDASITISYSDVESGDVLQVTASTAVSATGNNDSATVTFTAKDPVPTTAVDNDRVTGINQVTTGSTSTYTYTVKDQFGMTYTAKPTRLQWSYDGSTGVGSQSTTGVHTVSVKDNNTAAATETLDITTVDTFVGTTATGVAISQDPRTVDVVATLQTPGRVVISGIGTTDDDTEDAVATPLSALDERDRAAGDTTATTQDNVTVTVYDSNGALMPGANVTLTGPSTLFFADDFQQAAGQLTVRTGAGGQATVYLASNSTADQVFTATAGSATDTENVNYGKKTAYSAIANVTIDVPETVAAGSTLKATATFTDVYGNPVDTATNDTTGDTVRFSYDGPGLVVGTTATQTNSLGQISISVLMGSNETGSGTFVAYADPGEDKTVVNDNITVSKSVTIGAAIGEFTGTYGTVSAWTVDQGDGTAKVYVKFPTIGEKVRIGHQTGGSGSYETIYVKTTSSETMDGLRQVAGVGTYIVRTIDLASGTNRIRVDVGDDRLVQVRYND